MVCFGICIFFKHIFGHLTTIVICPSQHLATHHLSLIVELQPQCGNCFTRRNLGHWWTLTNSMQTQEKYLETSERTKLWMLEHVTENCGSQKHTHSRLSSSRYFVSWTGFCPAEDKKIAEASSTESRFCWNCKNFFLSSVGEYHVLTVLIYSMQALGYRGIAMYHPQVCRWEPVRLRWAKVNPPATPLWKPDSGGPGVQDFSWNLRNHVL